MHEVIKYMLCIEQSINGLYIVIFEFFASFNLTNYNL